MSEAEQLKAVYAYFTLDEWKSLALLVAHSSLPDSKKFDLMAKMPSASHPEPVPYNL